ncbi:MAG: DUF2442 domain-containing protein [Bacteroidales bacterium]
MNLIWVTDAKYVDGYRINITFSDGVNNVVDLSHRLNGALFEPLKDINQFKNFRINGWTIEWSGDVDLAPEYLYSL